MGTLLHFKDIYTEAFEGCRPYFVVLLLKAYSVFCVIMLMMAFYAFIYRAATGFEF
ncbi:DUF6747 family protein [Maribacter polysaccharolyticus]|uniref:DUF6747 family protein n=1 Tax=Maribacter polysaccharolyticus TaxID=3020831 RepID=UPI00237F7697|nr:DUF6747 family protein [Maribacter polysaccharolyticus]MDE3743628.1 hypothetical protein [Maribacter polysaccharolyticus]